MPPTRWLAALAAAGSLAAAGCAPTDHYVVAASGTTIGVDISLNPANQTPQGRLGYHRGELAVVPTNRGNCVRADGGWRCHGQPNTGADRSVDVLMELHFSDIFSGNAGIYQRLAVGEAAVRQPGAAFLFAKDGSGEIKPETAQAVAATLDADTIRIRQTQAYDLLIAEVTEGGKVSQAKMSRLFRCNNRTKTDADGLAARFKDQTADQLKAPSSLFQVYRSLAPDMLVRLKSCRE
jgi:hypothetical protein